MAEAYVEVKHSAVDETFAVLVRSCRITHAIDTMLFGDKDMAMQYCLARWKIPIDAWEGHLVCPDKNSPIRLNGEPVCYCGWNYDLDETETLYIQLERKVVEF
jgi:hypothetical protein